jgi:RimJ/RimL family protein N-acetyltransferase
VPLPYHRAVTELLTERLQLRIFRPDDFEAHAEISADPDVMRYIRAGPLERVDAWWQMARYVGHWRLRGYGIWAVIERSTGRLVGHLGFLDPEGGHGFELGWALARHAQGKGYALEGTRAAVHHAFTALNRSHIVCLIQPENARSIRLAERLGAAPERETEESGRRLIVFGIHRDNTSSTLR